MGLSQDPLRVQTKNRSGDVARSSGNPVVIPSLPSDQRRLNDSERMSKGPRGGRRSSLQAGPLKDSEIGPNDEVDLLPPGVG